MIVVAAGTSVPELAISLMAAVRRERDIAVGNAIGSCTFMYWAAWVWQAWRPQPG